jgi:hypothetical protein
MQRTIIVGALVLLGTVAATGCFPQEDSCNIKTPGIYVQFDATEESGVAVGRAVFWTGDSPGGTNLVLGDCGDAVAVNGVNLVVEDPNASPLTYSAEVDIADTYEFVFSRPDEGDYVSTVADMRPEVNVTAPGGEDIPRDQEFAVTWDDNDGSDDIELLISGDCIWDYPEVGGMSVADNGSYTVPANGLEPVDTANTDTCVAEVTLTRSVTGTLDSALKGDIYGRSVGLTSFNSTPPAI